MQLGTRFNPLHNWPTRSRGRNHGGWHHRRWRQIRERRHWSPGCAQPEIWPYRRRRKKRRAMDDAATLWRGWKCFSPRAVGSVNTSLPLWPGNSTLLVWHFASLLSRQGMYLRWRDYMPPPMPETGIVHAAENVVLDFAVGHLNAVKRVCASFSCRGSA